MTKHSLSRVNWPLLWGSVITLLVVTLAGLGPWLAPHDPMASASVAHVGANWISPPYPALAVPGYPLGSDAFGRDILSRLLWGVRPTLLLVTLVAMLRLALGLAIGVASGWSTGWVGRGLKTINNGALAVPVLLVGLAVNAALSVKFGVWTFVSGLVLTGWAESARLVREQTRLIKGQPYVEAAYALGASEFQVVRRHVVRQIAPLIWMLWAFEISGTLLLTAELGFLGYYIGGGVWMQTGDWTAVNVTGWPELGQLLATSYTNMLLHPEGMVAAGTVIFITVLGFNLLGDGLRRQLSLDRLRHETFFSKAAERVGRQLEHAPAYLWLKRHGLATAGAGLALLLGAVILLGWKPEAPSRAAAALPVPGGHGWAMERHDAQGTLWTDAPGPATSEIAWTFRDEAGGFSGGPVVAADGTVYIGSKAGWLYALRPDGALRWKLDVGAPVVGSPALGPYGDIYVTDETGRLSLYQPDQLLLWRFQFPGGNPATSGPVVASNSVAYYTLGSVLQAVSIDGRPLWQGKIVQFLYMAPRLSADGSLAFLYDIAFRTKDGSSFALQLGGQDASEFVNPMHVVGGDGQAYYSFGHAMIPWQMTEGGVTAGKTLTWFYKGQELQIPSDSGATADGIAWLFYSTEYSQARLVWMDTRDGRLLGNIRYMQQPSRLLAVGPGGRAYVCGLSAGETNCLAYQPGFGAPAWRAALGPNGPVSGGALVPGRLYVTTEAGWLFAIGDGAAAGTAAPTAPAAQHTPEPTWTLPFPALTLTPAP